LPAVINNELINSGLWEIETHKVCVRKEEKLMNENLFLKGEQNKKETFFQQFSFIFLFVCLFVELKNRKAIFIVQQVCDILSIFLFISRKKLGIFVTINEYFLNVCQHY
jgi:hypothetical protein